MLSSLYLYSTYIEYHFETNGRRTNTTQKKTLADMVKFLFYVQHTYKNLGRWSINLFLRASQRILFYVKIVYDKARPVKLLNCWILKLLNCWIAETSLRLYTYSLRNLYVEEWQFCWICAYGKIADCWILKLLNCLMAKFLSFEITVTHPNGKIRDSFLTRFFLSFLNVFHVKNIPRFSVRRFSGNTISARAYDLDHVVFVVN